MGESNEEVGGERTVLDVLKASQLKEVIQRFNEALKAKRQVINDLNVYPVPDGDTGTNMSLTMQSVVAEFRHAAADDMAAIAGAISKGAIMGARGNSGAILAQALRGVAESVKSKPDIGPKDVAEALEKATKAAYESVLKPVEGTILTVLSAAAEAARKSVGEGHTLQEQLEHIRVASAEALARTPDLLPILKQAGVVDAGGSGFLLFVDALRYVVTGEPIPGVTDTLGITTETEPEHPHMDLTDVHSEISDLQYEVMFLMDADDANIPKFRTEWSGAGDSIVVVGGDGFWNCHIHTDDKDAVVEIAKKYGAPREIRVTDLQEQIARVPHAAQGQKPEPEPETVETDVVAIVNGDGLVRIFRSFGVRGIVQGGQSMNPSVAEILEAVEGVASQSVVILPNNKNIHAAANQVNELTSKTVEVVPSTSVCQGMAALVSYDASGTVAEIADAMRESMSRIVCAEITQAIRKSKSDVGPIKKGDWLGIGPAGISVVTDSLQDALLRIVETLAGDDHEVLTLIKGEGASAEATDALRAWLAEFRPNIEMEVHDGGQALYPYLIGLE